eukprot:tig00000215_g18614.t2
MGSDRAGAFFKRSPAPRPSSDGAASSSSHQPTPTPAIYKYSGELDAATELLDRALYCLEAAWHPQFKPASGACRLDFAVMENKAWSSGACRCSFAAAAPAPPSCIDYFALRAREYKFLLELVAAPALPGAPPRSCGSRPSRAGAALFLPIALNSSAYALMRVARDGGAAPVDEPVLRRLFSHTLDPASPAPPRPLPRPSPPPPAAGGPHVPGAGARGWAALHRRPLFDDDEPAASVELPP